MNTIDWDKAPEGFPLWLEGTNYEHRKHSGWYREAGLVFEGADGGQWRAFREGQFFTVHRKPEPAAWTGDGLPPVGADVECTFAVEMHEIWHRGTVVHCASSPEGDQFVVVDTGEVSACYRVDGTCLRPYRTPEQIAADERLHSVRNACTAIAETLDGLRGKTKVERAALAVVEAMIDAGYRRVEP